MSKAKLLIELLAAEFGDEPQTLTKQQIKQVALDNDINSLYRVLNANNLADDGNYHFPPVGKSQPSGKSPKVKAPKVQVVSPTVATAPVPAPAAAVVFDMNADSAGFANNLVPSKDTMYVPFGHFKSIRSIIASNMFYPSYVSGLSGNGKTYMIEQACAYEKRGVIRVNLTEETDEDDLIGGFRLVAGETKFFKGPVIKAMEQGAVLLLDEIDLVTPGKVMCLQSIMEGSGYFIKKTGEFITPQAGFTVIATANTKGKGSDDGQFMGTNVLNEAFLERFPVTFEQEYPSAAIEKKILRKHISDDHFIGKLVDWADIIRKTYMDGGIDEIISTRRLVHIVKALQIFGDRATAIEVCTNRFDDETKAAFLELYRKVDETVTSEDE
jgi:MoxR-like ATPase